jgi:PHD/YefM family antitoxin component YafN of YafNO toxin-antitoxin module
MNAVNYSGLRKNLKHYLDPVYEDHEPLIILKKLKLHIFPFIKYSSSAQ